MSHQKPSVRFADETSTDLRSLTSRESRSRRRNRWRGTPSRWLALTKGDRLVATALNKERDRNLSLHLYCAFKLKQRLARERAQQRRLEERRTTTDSTSTSIPHHEEHWNISNQWTAWPLPVAGIPATGRNKEQDNDQVRHDPTKRTVFHHVDVGDDRAAKPLEDAILASILRNARRQFRRRTDLIEHTDVSNDAESTLSLNKDIDETEEEDSECAENEEVDNGKVKHNDTMYDEDEDSDGSNVPEGPPTVAVDDDLSAELLLPGVRAIVEKVDKILTVLHNVRNGPENQLGDDPPGDNQSANYLKDGSSHIPDDQHQERSILIRSDPSESDSDTPNPDESSERQAEDIQRKEIVLPKYANRNVAVTTPEASWPPQKEDCDNSPGSVIVESDLFSHAEHSGFPPGTPASAGENNGQEDSPKESHLYDWKDVLGAAVVAGFGEDVMARAAQRCADLFDDSIVLNMKGTDPPPMRHPGKQRLVSSYSEMGWKQHSYAPGKPCGKKNISEGTAISRERYFVPLASMGPPYGRTDKTFWKGIFAHSPSAGSSNKTNSRNIVGGEDVNDDNSRSNEDDDGNGGKDGDEGSSDEDKQRPYSRIDDSRPAIGNFTMAAKLYYCPVWSCERATWGFRRQTHLRRHSKLVHGYTLGRSAETASESPMTLPEKVVDVDPGEDRLLQPIRLRVEARRPFLFTSNDLSSANDTDSGLDGGGRGDGRGEGKRRHGRHSSSGTGTDKDSGSEDGEEEDEENS